MGIHPRGPTARRQLDTCRPLEAAEFYASFVRRNNTMPAYQSEGVVLTQDNLDMMERLLPRPLRWIGLRFAPRILMTELLQPDELARVGVTPIVGHSMVKAVLTAILRIGQTSRRAAICSPHESPGSSCKAWSMSIAAEQVEFGIAFSRLGLRSQPFTY
jgi:hypothetical protein